MNGHRLLWEEGGDTVARQGQLLSETLKWPKQPSCQ